MQKHYRIPESCRECAAAAPVHMLLEPKPLSLFRVDAEPFFVCDTCFFKAHMEVIDHWNSVHFRRRDT